MKIILILLFPLLSQAADFSWRKVFCQVSMMGEKHDKTIFYLAPGQKVSSRLSINRGNDEIFLTVDHNTVGDSEIYVKDYHFGTSSSPEVKIKVARKFKMADLKTSKLQIQTPTKHSTKTATIECELLP